MLLVLVLITSCIYFPQTSWYERAGSEGDFSKDTYLCGGIGCDMFSENTRIYYSYIIESGAIRFELLDENGKVVYELETNESGSGYITFDNKEPTLYYEHLYALSKDTVAHTSMSYEIKFNNFEKFLQKINSWSNEKLLGENWGYANYQVDMKFPSWVYELEHGDIDID